MRRAAALCLAGMMTALAATGCTSPSDPADPEAVATGAIVPADQRWWDDRTFYEIFVRSFADSDGDGIGDLQGVIDRLDYLNDGDPTTDTDLGVTGIWLMPVFASPSYHGYDVTDYRAINPDYGTVEDLQDLLAAAHDRGINVVLDYPLNHTSIEHPWFQDSRTGSGEYADWYVWIDGTSSETGPWGQRVWHEDGGRSYLGIFWEGMPDLNLQNPEVTAQIEEIASYWLDLGVDGFRLDGAQHLVEEDGVFANTAANKQWLTRFNDYVKSVRSDALLVGEIWIGSAISSSYVPSQVDIAFDFDTADAASDLASSGFGSDELLGATDRNLSQYPAWQVGVFTDNHDRDRLASLAGQDPGRLRFIATWLLTQPGVPFLYYGQEIGLPGRKPDERIRTPLPWTGDAPSGGFSTAQAWEPLADGWQQRNVAAQQVDEGSLLRHYAALVNIRNAHAALRTGEYASLEVDDSSGFAYVRTLGDEFVVVLGNASDEPVATLAVTLPEGAPQGEWASVLGPQAAQSDSQTITVTNLAPWETAILTLQ